MAEPISSEAYLAIAVTLHNATKNYIPKRQAEQSNEKPNTISNSSKSTSALPTDELLSYAGLKIGSDGYVHLAADSPARPRNWSKRRKIYDFGLILFSEFFMSAISAAGTPASFLGAEALGQTREVGLVAFTTMYLLGQALGALSLSPCSLKFGRRTLFLGSAFLYSVFCVPVAATSNIAGVFLGRFITGVISAIPAISTRHSIEDLFDAEGRMWAFFSWALVTNLGLVLGPVYAGYVAASLNWRWPFYLASIILAVTGLLMYFIRESHGAVLLHNTVAAIRAHRPDLILRTNPMAPRPAIYQPVILLVTNPTVFLSSLASAFSTALLYLFAVAFPLIYAHYAWTERKTTLISLFIALGLFFSTLTRFYDRHATRKARLASDRLSLERTLLGLAVGAPALAVGLWWFAWTIPGSHVRVLAWPASATSLVLTGYGINEYTTVLPRYILSPQTQSRSHKSNTNNTNNNSNNNDAASAFVALVTLRALLGATFPLFTRQMFETLGANAAGSVLAAIATAFCFLPFILVKSRKGWRGNRATGTAAGERDGGENAQEVVEVEEEEEDMKMKKKNEKAKPRKTVRWHDEETVAPGGLESADGENENEVADSSGFSSTETVVVQEGGDYVAFDDVFSGLKTDQGVSSRDDSSSVYSVSSEVSGSGSGSEPAPVPVPVPVPLRVRGRETPGGWEGGGCEGGGDGEGKTRKNEKEKEKKEPSRIDDNDDGSI